LLCSIGTGGIDLFLKEKPKPLTKRFRFKIFFY
jgi:hypothetical protein